MVVGQEYNFDFLFDVYMMFSVELRRETGNQFLLIKTTDSYTFREIRMFSNIC